jgi:hypothetical protein
VNGLRHLAVSLFIFTAETNKGVSDGNTIFTGGNWAGNIAGGGFSFFP